MRFTEKIVERTVSDDWSNYRGRPIDPLTENWKHSISADIKSCLFDTKKLKAVHPIVMISSSKDLHQCSACKAHWKDNKLNQVFRPKGEQRKTLFRNVPTGMFEDDKKNIPP